MVEKRGGLQRPTKSVSLSGIGKNSKRTDKQAIRSPNVQDSTDLSIGDRERIRQGQKVAPLSETPTPSVSPAPPRGTPSAAGAGAGLPDFVTDMPTNRPDEPLTSGMDIGPGSGSDILGIPPPSDDPRVIALERYAREFNNPTAQRYLDRIYRPQTPTPQTVAPPQTAEVPMEDDFADEEEPVVEAEEETTETSALA